MYSCFLLFLFLIAVPFSTVIHECGHLFAAKLVNANNITLYLGKGQAHYKIHFNRVTIIINNFFIFTGWTESKRKKPYSRLEMIFITIMGPTFNVIICFLFLYIYVSFPSNFVFIFVIINAWIAIINLFPFKMKNKKSDGYIIVQQIFKK